MDFRFSKVLLSVWVGGWTLPSPVLAQTTSGKAAVAAKPAAPALPGLQTGPAPWTRGIDQLTERLAAIGLPAMPKEEFAQHIHQHLTIAVRGNPVTVPAGIGINQFVRYISPIHTHDSTGTIHIESASVETFTLGQFFDVWGVRLTADCIGGYCRKAGEALQVTSDGAPVKDPRALPLHDKQEIQIQFETVPNTAKGKPASKTPPKK